jgi:hypothetical protein
MYLLPIDFRVVVFERVLGRVQPGVISHTIVFSATNLFICQIIGRIRRTGIFKKILPSEKEILPWMKMRLPF